MLYAAFFQDQPIAPTDQVTCPQRVFCVAMATQKYGIGRKGVKMLWLAEVRPRPNSLVRRTTSRRSVPMMRMPDVTDFGRDLHKPLCQHLCGMMPFGHSCGPLWHGSGQTLANPRRTGPWQTPLCAAPASAHSVPHTNRKPFVDYCEHVQQGAEQRSDGETTVQGKEPRMWR